MFGTSRWLFVTETTPIGTLEINCSGPYIPYQELKRMIIPGGAGYGFPSIRNSLAPRLALSTCLKARRAGERCGPFMHADGHAFAVHALGFDGGAALVAPNTFAITVRSHA